MNQTLLAMNQTRLDQNQPEISPKFARNETKNWLFISTYQQKIIRYSKYSKHWSEISKTLKDDNVVKNRRELVKQMVKQLEQVSQF